MCDSANIGVEATEVGGESSDGTHKGGKAVARWRGRVWVRLVERFRIEAMDGVPSLDPERAVAFGNQDPGMRGLVVKICAGASRSSCGRDLGNQAFRVQRDVETARASGTRTGRRVTPVLRARRRS